MSDASYTASTAEQRRDSALCACGHMRGIHKAASPCPCATTGCGCQMFRTRAVAAPPKPPAVVPGRVERTLPPGAGDRADDLAYRKREPESQDAITRFARHLRARMRALGWEQADLEKRAEISPRTASFALNGTRCDLPVADKLARLVGRDLATMLGPYMCGTCTGEPPAGFRCLECGTEARAS